MAGLAGDVVVYQYIDEERGRWGDRPYASDCVLVLEIVSADSVTTDTPDKRAEYAAAGIPHYWIVRMTNNNGPAISVERLLLPMPASTSPRNSESAVVISTRWTPLRRSALSSPGNNLTMACKEPFRCYRVPAGWFASGY